MTNGVKVHLDHGMRAGESIQDYVKRLQAENEALRVNRGSNIKISPKGAVSVYGLGRWPVTLYKSQWETLLGLVDEIRAFIKANDSKLTVKADKAEVAS